MSEIYQLKITLKHIRPPIWRRIQVKGNTTLGHLHEIIQIAMGWGNDHMHAFHIGMGQYGAPDEEFFSEMEDEGKVTLDNIEAEGDSFIYEYDFGDGWEHSVKVEKILSAEQNVHYPRCLTGKRACPPEDCGGPWGYQHLLDVLSDPKHEEYNEMVEWIGRPIDAEAFDIDGVNAELNEW
jgi:hypothetical protein